MKKRRKEEEEEKERKESNVWKSSETRRRSSDAALSSCSACTTSQHRMACSNRKGREREREETVQHGEYKPAHTFIYIYIDAIELKGTLLWLLLAEISPLARLTTNEKTFAFAAATAGLGGYLLSVVLCSPFSLASLLSTATLVSASTQSPIHPVFCKDDTWHCKETAATQPTGRRKFLATPTKCNQSDPVALLWQLTQTDSSNRICSWFFVLFFFFYFFTPAARLLHLIYSVYISRVCRILMPCALSVPAYSATCSDAATYTLCNPSRLCVCTRVFTKRERKRIGLATTNQQ